MPRPLPALRAMDKAAAPHRVRRRRLLSFLLALSALIATYAILFTDFYHLSPAIEKVFAATSEGRRPLDIYLEALSVDPVKQSLQVRLDFAATAEPGGLRHTGAPATDMLVEIGDGMDVQDIALQAGQAGVTRTLQLYVRGALENYPVDRYEGKLLIGAFEGKKRTARPAGRVRLTTWEEIPTAWVELNG